MIRSFEIVDPANTHIEWMAKVPALAKPRTFEFKPGLNILWGKNGSGKSTVIKALARLFHCEQGGTPVVTSTSLEALFQRRYERDSDLDKDRSIDTLPKAVKLEHDGQAVRYFDPSVAVGLLGGGAAFDDDFFGQGVANTMFKGSAGQTTMFRFDSLIRDLINDKVPEIVRKIHASRVNDLWSERVKAADEFLKGSGEKGPLTILLDEPERSYDLPHQVAVWRFIRSLATKYQLIIASHSFFALRIPEAHYIELEDDYLSVAIRCLAFLANWKDEKVPPLPPPDKKAEEKPKKKR